MSSFARRIIVFAAAASACAGMGLTGLAVRADDIPATAVIDQKAPDFSLAGVDGKTYRLSDFKGKYVVLEWINFECPFVKKHYTSGNMQTLQKQYTGKDVVWFTICSSAEGKQGYYEPDALAGMIKERKLASTAYLRDEDGKVGRLYGAKTTPHMFVINPEGVLIYAGAIDDRRSTNPDDIASSKNFVTACLDASLAGKPVETRSTPSYGCSVKYAD
jgi:alkyl hydroperoxide reductase subunit AhpC